MNIPDGFLKTLFLPSTLICFQLWAPQFSLQSLRVATPAIVDTSIVMVSCCMTRAYSLTVAMSFLL